MSNFAFLAAEFPAVHEAAVEAERQAAVSPTAASRLLLIIAPTGPEKLFDEAKVERLFSKIQAINDSAVA